MNEIKRLLESSTDQTLKILHDMFGFDYLKPYGLYMINGRFTLNQIDKIVNADGYSILDSVIILLVRDREGYTSKFHLVKYDGTIYYDFKIYRYTLYYRREPEYKKCIDSFYRKSDFERVRKSATAETIIICQRRDYITIPAAPEIDYSDTNERYNYLSNIGGNYQGRRYISQIDFTDRITGRRYHRDIVGRVFYTNAKYPETVADILDKSGYFVLERRADLKRRANALRSERQKAAFIASDNTDRINQLYRAILAARDNTARILSIATTAADFERVSNILARWQGLSGIVSDYELLKARDDQKTFSSIDNFNNAYNRIVSKLETIKTM